jgi:hypothetical protein
VPELQYGVGRHPSVRRAVRVWLEQP